jgi:hypothetical protein
MADQAVCETGMAFCTAFCALSIVSLSRAQAASIDQYCQSLAESRAQRAYAKPPFGSPEHVLAYLGRYPRRADGHLGQDDRAALWPCEHHQTCRPCVAGHARMGADDKRSG